MNIVGDRGFNYIDNTSDTLDVLGATTGVFTVMIGTPYTFNHRLTVQAIGLARFQEARSRASHG